MKLLVINLIVFLFSILITAAHAAPVKKMAKPAAVNKQVVAKPATVAAAVTSVDEQDVPAPTVNVEASANSTEKLVVDGDSAPTNSASATAPTATGTDLENQVQAQVASTKTEDAGQKKEEMKNEALSEEQIPVFAKNTEKKSVAQSSMQKTVYSVVILALLGLGGWFVLRKSYKNRSKSNTNTTKIKVLTQHHLGPRKTLAIISVAGESMLVGITDHNISLLKNLSLLEEEIPEETPRNFKNTLFGKTKLQEEEFVESDEFSLGKIKDVVSGKLRGMKEI